MNPTIDPTGRLGAERVRTESLLAQLSADFDALVRACEGANTDDEHDPEGTTIGFERAQLATLIAGARLRLVELDRAEGRLQNASYGRCETCGEPIGAERLCVRPTARECIRCAARR
jgi:DnaK suppressor protein